MVKKESFFRPTAACPNPAPKSNPNVTAPQFNSCTLG